MARFLLRGMNTRTLPLVDFGCRHGKLSYIYDDIFVARCYTESDFSPNNDYYDEIIGLIRDDYDGTDTFYDQVLRSADQYINESLSDYGIPANVRSNSCTWDIPRSGWYDTAIEFDLDLDLDWVDDTFMELKDDPDFIQYVKDTFRSRDGFISYIPDNIAELKELLDPTDSEYWKVVAVLIKYFIYCDESVADNVSEELIEDIQGNADFTTCSELEIY